MAKPSKKAKVNKPVDDPKAHESKQQWLESKNSMQNVENPTNEPPPESPEASMVPITADESGAKPPSPAKSTKEVEDDVVVTGTAYTTPGNTTVLSKHNSKEEFSAADKGKW